MSLSRLLDPAFLLLVLLGAALVAGTFRMLRAENRRVRISVRVAWGAWVALFLLSAPRFATQMASWTQAEATDVAPSFADVPEPRRAMVVLSGGMRHGIDVATPREQLGRVTTARVVGAAALYRRVPMGHVVVSGSDPSLPPRTVTKAMADLLMSLGVPQERILLEPWSRDTRENAHYSAMLLEKVGVDRVAVVTSALHSDRAMVAFRQTGLDVVAAPVDFDSVHAHGLSGLLPSSGALWQSHAVLHELLGRLEPGGVSDTRWGGGPPPDWDERSPPRP